MFADKQNSDNSGWGKLTPSVLVPSVMALFPSFTLAATPIAADNATRDISVDPLAMSGLLQMTFGLLVVLALIFAVAWAARRFGGFSMQSNSVMKTLAVMPLGGREKIALVQVGEKQLVIGVAPGRVQTLHVFDEPIVSESPEDKNSFADKLAKVVKDRLNS